MNKICTNYNGGKGGAGTYQQIINHIRPHKYFVSPFAGKDGIFRKIKRAPVSVLNDLDERVLIFWRAWLKKQNVNVCENYMQANMFETPTKPIVILRNQDGLTLIEKFKNSQDTLIYCDPPYPMATRTHKAQIYLYETTDALHNQLLNAIQDAKADVIISSYPNDLYEKKLQHWNKHTFSSITRAGRRTEIIYFNYPAPLFLHDLQYLGNNFREREQIKRRVAGWSQRLAKMPPAHRIAILSQIVNQYQDTTKTIIEL